MILTLKTTALSPSVMHQYAIHAVCACVCVVSIEASHLVTAMWLFKTVSQMSLFSPLLTLSII